MKILVASAVAAASLLFGLLLGVGGMVAHAQITPAQTNCSLSAADFAALSAVLNNPDLTPEQEFQQELALRRSLLAKTIACAVLDAHTLQVSLSALQAPDSTSASVGTQLSNKIDDTINFYNLEAAKAATAGISGTKAIAREIQAWRTANYLPLVGQTNNLLLWSENQGLFKTAQNRLNQTGQVVNFIESAAANNDLLAAYNAAQTAFGQAIADNDAAEASLAGLQSPDQSLTRIQQSLQSLANTYQRFGALNKLIQQLLPTGQ